MNNQKDHLNAKITELLSPFANEMEDERLGVFLALSVGRVLLNSRNIEIDTNDLRHITDWLKSSIINNETWLDNLDTNLRPKKLMKFSSIEAIMQEADKAMLINSQKMSNIIIKEGDEELVSQLENGYYIVKLLTPKALDRESAQMQHCIGQGSYDEYLDDDSYLFLSLRDPAGKAHVTLEINENKIVQIQGKQNKFPMQKYMDVIVPFLMTQKYQINQMEIPHKIGFLSDKEGNWHDINNLPANLIISGNLDLRKTFLKFLPKNFTVEGNLNIEDMRIERLPSGLKIKGTLYAMNSHLKELPSDIEVGGLNIYRTEIDKLPDHITKYDNLDITRTRIEKMPTSIKEVKGTLNLSKTRTAQLPNGLIFVHDLNISNTKISLIPKNLKMTGKLDISSTPVKAIPKNAKYENLNGMFSKIKKLPYLKNRTIKNLMLFGSPLEELPDNLTIEEKINLSKTPIKKLPNNLTVKGAAEFRDCMFEEFPIDIKLGSDIDLIASRIKNIDNITHIKGYLNLAYTESIEYLPNKLTVDHHLNLSYSGLKELPLNLIVKNELRLKKTDIEKLPSCLSVKILNLHETKITEIPEGVIVESIINMEENQISYFPDSIADNVLVIELIGKTDTNKYTVGEFRNNAINNVCGKL